MASAQNSPIAASAAAWLDALSQPSARLDGEGRIVLANRAWTRAHSNYGLDCFRLGPGAALADALAAAPSPTAFSTAFEGVRSGAHARAEVDASVQVPQGVAWLAFTVARVEGEGLLVQFADITRRVRAEEQLRLSKSKLRSVVAGAPIVLLGLDLEGVFTVVEGIGAAGLGATPELLLGRSAFEVYAHIPALLECVRGAMVGETRIAAVPVGRMTYELRCSPSLDEAGEVKGVIGVATDITERTRIEQMKNEFVSIVSHELRTPLTSIRGSLGLLEGGVAGELPGRAGELVRIARSNSERLIRLINDILDLDKLEAGRLEFISEQLDMAKLLHQCAEELQGVAVDAGVRIEVQVDESADLGVLGDRDRLLQVLVNLCSNALKFAPENSAVVLAGLRMGPGRLRFEVRDRGPGIPADQRELLFKKFQQLGQSASRTSGGSGLGLAISKAIIDAHNGRIDLRSEVGAGSTFFFELPSAQSRASRPARARPAGVRGRTVEIEVGGIPDPTQLSISTRIDTLVAALEYVLEAPGRESFVEAHAEAAVVRATTADEVDDEVRARLDELVSRLAKLIAGETVFDDERDALAAAIGGLIRTREGG